MAKEELTPMMKQFYDLKSKHPDAVLLFRCGDFYETYCDDAVIAAQVLGITLTRRNNGKSATATQTEMAGFPHHALDTYLPRLVRAGYRVAICDQLEDPKFAKKLVKRGITELVTPGVAIADNVEASRMLGKEFGVPEHMCFDSADSFFDACSNVQFAGSYPKRLRVRTCLMVAIPRPDLSISLPIMAHAYPLLMPSAYMITRPSALRAARPMVCTRLVSERKKPSLSASKMATRLTSGRSRPSRSRLMPMSTSKSPRRRPLIISILSSVVISL